MILLIDNYDSFTYNLAQALGALGADVRVVRHDALDVAGAVALAPRALVISPGPGTPAEAGISNDLIRHFNGKIPILGVCLGHQCIGAVMGAQIQPAGRLLHGKSSRIYHEGKQLFLGLPNPFPAGRYHSLLVAEESLPGTLEITAHTVEAEIMGLRVRGTQTQGVQFHPESVLTPDGMQLLRNFVGGIP